MIVVGLPPGLANKEFLIVRHGESTSNMKGYVGGQQVDEPLSEKGEEQVDRLAGLFMAIKAQGRTDLLPGYIMHSGMERTEATARRGIKEALDDGVPVYEESGFKDWDFGDLSWKPVKDYPYYTDATDFPRGGESRWDFYRRSNRALAGALERHSHEGLPAIAAHQGTIVSIVEAAGYTFRDGLPTNAVLYHFKPRKMRKSGDFPWDVTTVQSQGNEIIESKVAIDPQERHREAAR